MPRLLLVLSSMAEMIKMEVPAAWTRLHPTFVISLERATAFC